MAGNDILPGLAPAFEMAVERGNPVEVGQLAIGGKRSYQPVTGGRFSGDGVSGEIVGGGETLFGRASGVAVVEAVYYLRSTSGWVTRLFGNGYRTTEGDFAGLRMSLLFEADEQGALAHLAAEAFVGEQADGAAILTVSRIT